MAKYDYKKLAKAKKMTEKELNAFFREMNKTGSGELVYLLEDNSAIKSGKGIKLNQDQIKKGCEYLYNLGFTPTGRVRSNSPFGNREEVIVTNCKEITFIGTYNTNWLNPWRIPVYMITDKFGNSFDYYVYNGLHIVG
jgi:hypothetical protein